MKQVFCLVNFSKRGIFELKELDNELKDFSEIERIMKLVCHYNLKIMENNGYSLILAEKKDGLFEAKYIADIGSGDDEDIFVDVAENDIRVMFHRCVNLKDEPYTCVACHNVMETEHANDLCQKCIDEL